MKQKTIPTMLALLIIVGGLVAGTVLTQGVQFLTSRASPGNKPSSVKLTNLSDRNISIAWTTDADTVGFIRYGKTKERMETTALDDAASQTAGTTHHATLKNLEAGTAYFYVIGVNDGVLDNNGTPFTLTTAPPLDESPPQRPILQGRILDADGTEVGAALVFLTIDSTTLSTITQTSGRWSIPLTDKRTADGQSFLLFPPKQSPIDIFVQTGKGASASAVWNVTFADDTTVPDIRLGEEQNFGDARAARLPSQTATPSSPFGSLQDVTVNLRDDDKLATGSPTFSGTGKPGENLTITVESENPVTATITVNPDGSWNFTPSTQLTPGQHTLTIRTPSGETITRTFTVTGPTPSPSPSPTPTPKPSPSPTPRPTSTPSATPSATIVPVGGGLPDTASFNPIAWVLLLGIILVGGGLFSSSFRPAMRRKRLNKY